LKSRPPIIDPIGNGVTRRHCRQCAASLLNLQNKVPVIRRFGAPPPLDRDIGVGHGGTTWRVPEETPVAFIYNGRNYAVMLASPDNLDDFAIGFSLTERIVNQLSEIEAVDIHQGNLGVDLRIRIAATAVDRLEARQQRRNLVGRAGCGVCGIENADVFFESLPRVAEAPISIDMSALNRAAGGLEKAQPLNTRTRTVHAAGWASLSGDILMAREDVGRHNALDKLLGALSRNATTMDDGFVVMSSRCSYEIVEKSVRLGVKAVLSLSGPTAFAIRKAEEANLGLYVRSGGGVVKVN
jgi:formate dehydrogenase accessory protein FdhD